MASTIASTSQSSGGSSAVGSASASASASTSTTVAPFTSFSSYIDSRILRALSSLGYTHPTPVQSHVFPLAISENKDILARARTGSGKTYAYAIPAIQKIINVRKALDGGFTGNEDWLATRVLILVPTRELAEQVASHIRLLCGALREQDEIRIANIAGGAGAAGTSKGASDKTQRLALADRPDIVIATPSRALVHLRSGSLQLNLLECLIIDEADLILSYGHSSDDIRSILSGGSSSSTSTSAAPSTSASTGSWSLPAVYQSFLMSATLTGEVDELKSVVLRNPVTIKLSDAQSAGGGASGASAAGGGLTQYSILTTEDDKFLLIYVILKLKLVKGKVLIFVNDTDRGYRLKLFLERFGIRSGVLNAELPFNSRYHAVQEFNRGVFNYLIATDESGLEGLEKDEDDEESEVEGERQQSKSQLISTQMDDAEDADEVAEDDDATGATGRKRKAADDIPAPRSKSKKKRKAQYNKTTSATEYGVTRGIDFVDVACVINFDLPASSRSYTHRIGRTARAGRSGMSLSFVVPRAQWGPSKQRGGFDTSLKSAKRDEKIWKRIERDQRAAGVLTGPNAGSGSSASGGLQEYRFDMTQVEGFRYRMEDALRSVTRASVREARIKEIKNEVLNSEKLKAHFEDNPKDLEFLKHDKPIAGPGGSRTNSKHMKHVPSYLMPRIAPVGGATASSSADVAEGAPVPATKSSSVPLRKKNAKDKRGGQKGGKGFQKGKKADPLKSFRRK